MAHAPRIFDPQNMDQYVRSLQQASEITGRAVCTADEEQAASEAFMAWAQSLGLRGTFYRTLTNGGAACWVLKLDAGRGTYEVTVANPIAWATAVQPFGLPMDTISAEWIRAVPAEWA